MEQAAGFDWVALVAIAVFISGAVGFIGWKKGWWGGSE